MNGVCNKWVDLQLGRIENISKLSLKTYKKHTKFIKIRKKNLPYVYRIRTYIPVNAGQPL